MILLRSAVVTMVHLIVSRCPINNNVDVPRMLNNSFSLDILLENISTLGVIRQRIPSTWSLFLK